MPHSSLVTTRMTRRCRLKSQTDPFTLTTPANRKTLILRQSSPLQSPHHPATVPGSIAYADLRSVLFRFRARDFRARDSALFGQGIVHCDRLMCLYGRETKRTMALRPGTEPIHRSLITFDPESVPVDPRRQSHSQGCRDLWHLIAATPDAQTVFTLQIYFQTSDSPGSLAQVVSCSRQNGTILKTAS